MSTRVLPLTLLAATLACGCAGRGNPNPSFAVTTTEARDALREMARSPRLLERPVVILGGLNDPGFGPGYLAAQVRRVSGDRRVMIFTFGPFESLDACGRRIARDVQRRFPGDDPLSTAEVDVVAVSMGGVVARAAAAPAGPNPSPKLRIARLFTISSPHRGAAMARWPALPIPGHVQTDLRPGSSFLRTLAEREVAAADYETRAYVRLGDRIVGQANASREGEPPHWLSTPPLEDPHHFAFRDPRIVADIVRRLRGEPPFATDPPEPLPHSSPLPPGGEG